MALAASSAELFPALELRLGQQSAWLVLETPFVKDLAQNEARNVVLLYHLRIMNAVAKFDFSTGSEMRLVDGKGTHLLGFWYDIEMNVFTELRCGCNRLPIKRC